MCQPFFVYVVNGLRQFATEVLEHPVTVPRLGPGGNVWDEVVRVTRPLPVMDCLP